MLMIIAIILLIFAYLIAWKFTLYATYFFDKSRKYTDPTFDPDYNEYAVSCFLIWWIILPCGVVLLFVRWIDTWFSNIVKEKWKKISEKR